MLVAKFLNHLQPYRQEHIFGRAGHLIARSTLAQGVGECGAQLQPLVQVLADELRRHAVLHAGESPVAMLKPAHLRDCQTHRAYVWSYCTTSANPTKAVQAGACRLPPLAVCTAAVGADRLGNDARRRVPSRCRAYCG